MFKYQVDVDEEYGKHLAWKLDLPGINDNTLESITTYFYVNAQLLDRIIEGYKIWLSDKETEPKISNGVFFLSLLKIFDIFKEHKDRFDGIVEKYLADIDRSFTRREGEGVPWQAEGHAELHSQVKGLYKRLVEGGLKQDFIDRYYFDGNLIQIYELCIEVVCSLEYLGKTRNPSVSDVMDGLMINENKLTKLYNILFVEKFDRTRGFYTCIEQIVEMAAE
ncbi:MAG: hypothetical protein ACLFQV_04840 [Vulcanimicrobiota bacterium]